MGLEELRMGRGLILSLEDAPLVYLKMRPTATALRLEPRGTSAPDFARRFHDKLKLAPLVVRGNPVAQD